jgi:hypothetical protein
LVDFYFTVKAKIMGTSNQTRDHRLIKKWAEERNGIPAKIKGTGNQDSEGILRIHFPENSDSDNFQEISWKDFFEDFEVNNLDFLYQEQKENGETSTFHKFVNRV